MVAGFWRIFNTILRSRNGRAQFRVDAAPHTKLDTFAPTSPTQAELADAVVVPRPVRKWRRLKSEGYF